MSEANDACSFCGEVHGGDDWRCPHVNWEQVEKCYRSLAGRLRMDQQVREEQRRGNNSQT